MSHSKLDLILVTQQTATAGRDTLLRQGIVGSLGAHSLAATALFVFGWLDLGSWLDPVLPYPPERDRAAISIPFQGATGGETARAQHLEVLPAESSQPAPPPELVPADTALERPVPAEAELAAARAPGEAAPPPELEMVVLAKPTEPAEDTDQPPAPLATAGAMSRASAGVDTSVPPRTLVNPAPQYPREALLQRLSGTVTLRVSVGADGRVLAVQIHESSGVASLDTAAREAVKNWKFLPARDPDAAPRPVLVPIEFVIRSANP